MKDTPMEILVEQAADRVIVRVVGDVTASRSGDLEDRVVPSIGAGLPPVDIDLAGMSFLSSTGLAVLVRLMRQARQHKQPMRLLSPVPHIERMLRIANMPIGG
jgi:anti-anti-sigma factor